MVRRKEIDPITLEILQNALISTCDQMSITMACMAYSAIFSEGRDLSMALLDDGLELAAMARRICPTKTGNMPFMAKWCMEDFEQSEIRDGDVIISNDPYRGGTHLPEFIMIKPIFYDQEIIAYGASIAHTVDIGGRGPGGFAGDATDVFQEGLRIPPVKLHERGQEVADVWKIYLSNVRTPKNAYGDMKAMHAAMLTADKRVKELVTKYGVGTVKACLAQIKDYSERRMRGEIDQIPDGVYESTDYFEDDGVSDEGPFEIRATVYVEGSDIIIDYTGSSKQAEGPINATYGVTVSDAAIGILMSTDHTIPVNSGCFRPIHVIVPSGTVANVNYPGPCMAGITELGNRLVEAVMNALKPAIPSKAVGSHGGTCVNVTYGGVNPETGEQFAHYQWEGVGWGGTPTHDGNDAQIAYVGNATLQPVEVLDARVPWLTLSLELTPHSGGPGKFRGGLGVTRTMRLTAPEIRLNAMTDRHKLAAQGIFGGKPGATGALLIRTSDSDRFRTFVEAFGTRSPSKFSNIKLHEGDTLVIKSPGGGGYGDPRQRDIQYVLKDVRDGMVSIEDAKEEYAVIIKPETLKVDEEATARLRKRLREQGKGTNELARVQEVHYRSRN